MSVVFSKAALIDLRSIRWHIGLENPAAATRIAVQIIAACDRLEYLPVSDNRTANPVAT